MKLDTFVRMVQKQYKNEGPLSTHLTGAERYVSGDPKIDSHLHYLETNYGVRVFVSDDYGRIVKYEVLDDNLFTIFLLKWA